MSKRLLCLGLVLVASQLFATGCQRWRANHPCLNCTPCSSCAEKHPLLHPVQTRHAMQAGSYTAGSSVGPVITNPPCHGCAGGSVAPGYPVGLSGKPGSVVPITGVPPEGYPPIGYPMPITPGPTVVPSHELPNPMPVPKTGSDKP